VLKKVPLWKARVYNKHFLATKSEQNKKTIFLPDNQKRLQLLRVCVSVRVYWCGRS